MEMLVIAMIIGCCIGCCIFYVKYRNAKTELSFLETRNVALCKSLESIEELNKKLTFDLGEAKGVLQGEQRQLQEMHVTMESKLSKMMESLTKHNRNALTDDLNQKLKLHESVFTTTLTPLIQAVNEVKDTNANLNERIKDASNMTSDLWSIFKYDVKKRGDWGEFQLQRVFEAGGLTKNVHFDLQPSLFYDNKVLRPDAWIKLPEDLYIIVDSKNVLFSTRNQSGAESKECKSFRDKVNKVIQDLSQKDYSMALKGTGRKCADFVVLFFPVESVYLSVFQEIPEIFEKAMQKKIILATPMTLLAIVNAVAYGWRHFKMQENAEKISALTVNLHKRFETFHGHYKNVGATLHKVQEMYNKATQSYNSRLLPCMRNIGKLSRDDGEKLDFLSKDVEENLIDISNISSHDIVEHVEYSN